MYYARSELRATTRSRGSKMQNRHRIACCSSMFSLVLVRVVHFVTAARHAHMLSCDASMFTQDICRMRWMGIQVNIHPAHCCHIAAASIGGKENKKLGCKRSMPSHHSFNPTEAPHLTASRRIYHSHASDNVLTVESKAFIQVQLNQKALAR